MFLLPYLLIMFLAKVYVWYVDELPKHLRTVLTLLTICWKLLPYKMASATLTIESNSK